MSAQAHFRAFLLALQFLTRIPVPVKFVPVADDYARSALYYPQVGLLIGLLLSLCGFLLNTSEAALLAAILLIIAVTMTGALHLDGLADSADAWLGGIGDLNKTHAILKDPLVGTAGVVAVFCILLIKYSALYVLIKDNNYIVIVLFPLLGRASILLLFTSTDYVRKQGLAASIVDGLNGQAALYGLIPVLLISVWVSFSAVLAATLVFIALRKMMIQRLGGCTGDTVGANVEIIEATWLCVAALG